ncbi:DNA-methyltransferase [Paenibacillus naphthalenovorans]|uniref:Methyltransferase n=1 Tax=Paenibacillus naphthalenovorans TaxID=162209 RepID=A0A0U2W9X6_9BACL|nr:site-specific DNA-methyltransferase [Paenibacillus naphthalenovorans]ALS22170.1 DNA methylase [Paenibacillus naphthalenovorans]
MSKKLLGSLELNRVYQRDTLEGMKLIPDESIDLTVTDPPYLMNYRSNRRVKQEKFDYIKNDKDSHELISEYIKELYRIHKNDTAVYMFCSWHHIDFFKQEFEKYFTLKNLIVWNKNNHGSGDLKGSYAPKHELILYGHKGRSLFRDKRIPDVIDFAKIPSVKLTHPTEKPVGLLEIFIKNNSDEGNIVFDGFGGSGSTFVAAKNLKRNYIGFEIEKQYIEMTNLRLESEYDEDTDFKLLS